MGFETPLALLGLVLAGLPVLAHLMRRRDLPVVELPTIALLARAQAQSKSRTRLVDLLLLCCRILLIAILVLSIAGPFVEMSLAYGDGRRASLAIVIDDSMSMGRAASGGTLLSRARRRAGEVIASLPPGSELSIVMAGHPARVLVARTEDLREAAALLETIEDQSARATDLPAATTLALRELSGARHEARKVLLLTDGAAHARLSDVRLPDAGIRAELERMSDEPEGNVAIVSAVAVPDPTTPGQASVRVEIRAFGASPDAVELSLHVGNDEIARTSAPISEGLARVTLHAPLTEQGDPSAEVRLEPVDALATDDRRSVLLRARAAARALIVDGSPHASRDRDEVGLFTRALELAPRDHGYLSYRVVDPDTFASHPLAGWDAVVLANVPVPPAHAVARLRRLVEEGGGLLVTAGDHVAAGRYRARFADLLPARPGAVSVLDPAQGMTLGDGATVLASDRGLSSVQTRQRMSLEPAAERAWVELRFDDGAPALVLGSVGEGRTGLLATTVDADWTDLPYRPGYLPMVVALLEHLSARAGLPIDTVEPGEEVTIARPPGATRLVLLDPTGARFEHEGTDPFVISETDTPGAYRVLVETRSRELEDDARAAFVVAPPAAESDLSLDELPTWAAGGEDRSDAVGAAVRRSVSPWLFALVGVLAVLEGLLRVGRRRREARPREAAQA